MKLLFDENLSPKLVGLLAVEFPDSEHVDGVGLHGRSDREIRAFAGERGFTIVSKDSDFRDLASALGAPPKAVWIQIGNAGTVAVQRLLTSNRKAIEAFGRDPEEAFLILSVPGDGEVY